AEPHAPAVREAPAHVSAVSPFSTNREPGVPITKGRRGANLWVPIAAAVAGLLLGGTAMFFSRFSVSKPAPSAPTALNFTELAPAGTAIVPGTAVSPDGRSLAFT